MTRSTLIRHAWLQMFLWIGIAVTLNHITSARFARIDMTANQAYTLSEAARLAVSDLERPLHAKVWFTDDLDPPFHHHKQSLLDRLDELAAWSGGHIEISVADPSKDPSVAAQAQAAGVRPVPYVYKDWDRKETRVVYMGVSFSYGAQNRAVDALPRIDKMEYELVRAILAVTTPREDEVRIGWLQGNGEPDLSHYAPTNPLGQLRDRISDRYTLTPLAIGDTPIDEDIETLLVVGPQLGLTEMTQFHLDQFLMRGGRIAWFISGFQPDFSTMKPREVHHDLHGILGHYGVVPNRDSILDRVENMPTQAPIRVGDALQVAQVAYPLVPKTSALDRTVSAVRNLRQMVFPFATTLSVSPEISEAVDAEVWVKTSDSAVSTRLLGTLETQSLRSPLPDEVTGPFPLIVALSGTFRSYFAGRSPPLPTASEAEPIDPETVLLDSRPTRMVVVSSSDMIANNLDFVLNTLDWLAQDRRLIEIRSRDTATATFTPPNASEVWLWRLGIAGLPLFLVLLGGGVQLLRTR